MENYSYDRLVVIYRIGQFVSGRRLRLPERGTEMNPEAEQALDELIALFQSLGKHTVLTTQQAWQTLQALKELKRLEVDTWNTRPIEDALNARIAELEAENNELTERVSMLDVTGVFQKLGEMRTIELVADLKAERDEAKAMVERLIEAIELGNGVVLMHEPEISSVQKWYAKMATVIAEWREREE